MSSVAPNGGQVCCIEEVITYCHTLMLVEVESFTAALREADSGFKMGQILDYFTPNLDNDMLPILMIQEATEQYGWFSMPSNAEETIALEFWGLVEHDDPRVRARAIRKMASVLVSVFNRQHLSYVIREGFELFFNDKCPIKLVNYGAFAIRGTKNVSAFTAYFAGDIIVNLPPQA